jgi:hypothetical protein
MLFYILEYHDLKKRCIFLYTKVVDTKFSLAIVACISHGCQICCHWWEESEKYKAVP